MPVLHGRNSQIAEVSDMGFQFGIPGTLSFLEFILASGKFTGDVYTLPSDELSLSTTGAENAVVFVKNSRSNVMLVEFRISADGSSTFRLRGEATAITGGTNTTPQHFLRTASGGRKSALASGSVAADFMIGGDGDTLAGTTNLLQQVVMTGGPGGGSGGNTTLGGFIDNGGTLGMTVEHSSGTLVAGATAFFAFIPSGMLP